MNQESRYQIINLEDQLFNLKCQILLIMITIRELIHFIYINLYNFILRIGNLTNNNINGLNFILILNQIDNLCNGFIPISINHFLTQQVIECLLKKEIYF